MSQHAGEGTEGVRHAGGEAAAGDARAGQDRPEAEAAALGRGGQGEGVRASEGARMGEPRGKRERAASLRSLRLTFAPHGPSVILGGSRGFLLAHAQHPGSALWG
jgi:hypothetical protein